MRCVSVKIIDLGDWEINKRCKGEQLAKMQMKIEKFQNRNMGIWDSKCVYIKMGGRETEKYDGNMIIIV
jgi:hypothetical protein